MKNQATIQGALSIAALICIVAGWLNLFSPEINHFLSDKLFYILIGVSFILQAPFLSNPKFLYPMYAAGALCIIGAFLPPVSQISIIKTIGLLAGVAFSLFSRPRIPRNQ